MLSEKNLKDLKLSKEQLKIYRALEVREKALRSVLKKCGVYSNAIEGIIRQSDLNKVDLNNLEALEESVRQEWSEIIIK